jgi:hypothetical protein
MQKDSIRELVEALDQELAKNHQLSPQDREMLEGLRVELNTALSHSGRPAIEAGIVDKVRDAAERLEASHPDLTAVLMRMMDSLVKMGV